MKQSNLLGVLGGLGPMSTVYFCELLTAHTKALSDADHIDMLISSRASTPDRTAWILGKSQNDPLPVMLEEAHRLENAGANLLVIPCNTAHYFYDGLRAGCRVPILNIIAETIAYLQKTGVRKFGLLATEGTVRSGSYHRLCKEAGLTCITPDDEDQAIISSLIYDYVKQNKPIDPELFDRVTAHLAAAGCEKIVLGCTELSLIDRQLCLDRGSFADSLEILACRTILACGKEPVGFPEDFDLLLKGAAQ